jgi:hypothetical protein
VVCQTARNDLLDLEEQGLLEKTGKEMPTFFMRRQTCLTD